MSFAKSPEHSGGNSQERFWIYPNNNGICGFISKYYVDFKKNPHNCEAHNGGHNVTFRGLYSCVNGQLIFLAFIRFSVYTMLCSRLVWNCLQAWNISGLSRLTCSSLNIHFYSNWNGFIACSIWNCSTYSQNYWPRIVVLPHCRKKDLSSRFLYICCRL